MDPVAVWICSILLLSASAGVQCYSTLVWDTPGLKRQMYTKMQGTNGCYKLLNSTGAIGCEDLSRLGTEAPIMGIRDSKARIEGRQIVLIPVQIMDEFLLRIQSDRKLSENVVGVLVDSTTDVPAFSSQGLPFPLEQYAPYHSAGYKWNPKGSGINRQYLPFPVFALSPDIVADAWRRADYNAAVGSKATLHMAYLALTMNAQGSSLDCVTKGTCLPIGGHSVWAAMPPLPTDSSSGNAPGSKPIVLVTAQIEGTAMFHDLIQGAEAPMSGLFSLLGAVHCLARVQQESASWPQQLVFMALAGEAWDLMGSRYLLWALNQSLPNVQGLVLGQVQQVVEIGQVGQAQPARNGTRTFYAHMQRDPSFADASPLLSALQQASHTTPEFPTAVRPASPLTPGIPPSSLMAFLKVNRSLAGIVVTDFDTEFVNPYYESHLDLNNTIHAESVAAAAVLLARMLFSQASGRPGSELEVDRQSVLALVQDLISCWLSPSPGLLCQSVTQLMAPDYYMTDNNPDFAARHFIGVLPQKDPDQLELDPDSPQDPYGKKNMARFLWNFLANATASGGSLQACDFGKKLCLAGEVCVGWKSGSNLGVCMKATANYVPARSTRAAMCTTCYTWNITASSNAWSTAYGFPEDPVWAESFWPDGHPLVSMYHPERRRVEVMMLIAGVVLTLVSVLIALGTRKAFHNRLKSQ